MAGIRVTVPSTSLETRQKVRWRVPAGVDPAGWEGAWFLGSAAGYSQVNRIEGKPDALVVGDPVESAHYLSIKSYVNYLETQTLEPTAGTFAAICRSSDTLVDNAHRPVWIGNFKGTTSGGANLFTGGANSNMNAQSVDGSDNRDLAAAQVAVTAATWKLLIGTFDNDAVKIYNMTTGASGSTNLLSGYDRWTPITTMRIGSGANDTFQGIGDIAFAGILSRVMSSADERTALYNYLKTYYAARGIAI